MVFISLTRLRVKSYRYIIPFFLANESSLKQLRKTAGFLGGEELVDKNLTFWTLTMWTADSNMKEFRNSMPHRKAMQKLPIWCNEASYMHWTQSEPNLPDWKIAYHKMVSEGHISKVREPSEVHLSKQYPEIKWKGSARKIKGTGM
jgi:hypothetical protein